MNAIGQDILPGFPLRYGLTQGTADVAGWGYFTLKKILQTNADTVATVGPGLKHCCTK